MRATTSIIHAGIRFNITSDYKNYLYRIKSIIDSYEGLSSHYIDTIDVEIKKSSLPAYVYSEIKKVHHYGGHPYLDFDAEYVLQDHLIISTWRSKGMQFNIDRQRKRVIVLVDDDDTRKVGWFFYLACKNLALYFRSMESGFLLHASALMARNNKAILFIGEKYAGKTTLFLESIINNRCSPLSNDRVFVKCRDNVFLESWPSDFSVHQGTLYKYPSLLKAAIKYNRVGYKYKFFEWDNDIQPIFERMKKHIYPLHWITRVLKKKYKHTGTLGYIIMPTLDIKCESNSFAQIDINDNVVRKNLTKFLENQCFDYFEKSFMAWHGLELPCRRSDINLLVNSLIDHDIKIYSLKMNPKDMSYYKKFLDSIIE